MSVNSISKLSVSNTEIKGVSVAVPMDIWRLICGHLNGAKDVIHLGLVNRQLSLLINDGPLWRSFVLKHFPDSYADLKAEAESPSFYKRLTIARQNIKAGKYRVQMLDDHQAPITSLVACDGKLISGSWDTTIKIWDLKSGQVLQTLRGHQRRVMTIIVHGDELISGSDDSTIKIWALKSGKELQTLNGRQTGVSCMAVYKDKLITGSEDCTIKIWGLESGEELQTLNGHQTGVSCMIVYNDKLISGSWKHIMIWDLENGNALQTINVTDPVTSFAVHNGMLIYGSLGKTIEALDLLKNGQTLKLQAGDSAGIVSYDGMLFSCSTHGGIQVWDHYSRKKVRTFDQRPFQRFKCITVFDGKIISGLLDGRIKIWDFNSAPYSKELLNQNLRILVKMPWAQYLQAPVKEFIEKLHPDFKERLKQHSSKLMLTNSYNGFEKAILRVKTEVCLEALLVAIHDEDHAQVSKFLDYLIEIDPRNTEIYELLWEICGSPDFSRWGNHAFHNQSGYPSSLVQKAEAVIQFKQSLKECWGKDFPLLLADLGIFTDGAYYEKLKCTPDHLLKIGICSVADLKALGLFKDSFHFDHLKVVSEEVIESSDQPQDLAIIKKHDRILDKKKSVSSLLKELYDAAGQMAKGSEHGALFYKADNIWTAFQKKLRDIQTALNSQTRTEILSLFGQGSYREIARQMNMLIYEFRKLECEHQIAILSAYINQFGILAVWNDIYKPQNINSLSSLLKRKDAPQDLFRMGI